MAIQLLRSTTPGAVPTGGQLAPGQLALNLADSKVFWEDAAGVVQSFTLIAGSGSDLPRGYLTGFGLANNATDATNDIDIADGACRDSANGGNIVLASGITKRLDATWAVGTGNGWLDTGSVANGTYHVWAIKRPDTGVVDSLASLSPTSPTMPANYTLKRRIGSILRESGAIVGFVQSGDLFRRKVAVNSVSTNAQGTSAITRTLHIPTGIPLEARIAGTILNNTVAAVVLLTPMLATDTAPVINSVVTCQAVVNTYGSFQMDILTDTSAQIRSRAASGSTHLYVTTHGWTDRRGQDG